MADYSDQFIFVMNQIDRLPTSKIGEVCDDLVTALEADGLAQVVVIPMSASPPAGPPIGLDHLAEAIDSARDRGWGLYRKLLTDLAVTGRALYDEAGSGIDFDVRAQRAADAAAESLTRGNAPEAVSGLTSFLDSIAAESGELTAAKIEEFAAGVAGHVDRIRLQLHENRPRDRMRWFGRSHAADHEPDFDRARSLISEAVVRPARVMLARRALAGASIADLTLEVDKLLRQASR
jgi:hypothetical protein